MAVTATPELPDTETAADPDAMRDCLLWVRAELPGSRFAVRIDQVLAGDTDAVLRARIGADAALTPAQWDVLRLIDASWRTLGFAPTLQELGDWLGVTKVTAHGLVHALRRKGVVTVDRHMARSVRIVEK